MTAPSRSNEQGKRSSGRIVARIIWLSIKMLIIPVLCIMALIVGLAIGYTVLGDKPLSDVFDFNTWKHMYDLVFAEGG
ncbi:DNA-directed RNA polymerase subunit beta [Cohnella cholangitidis]|uniref:DNA-directed RNA polymerase subunit beta n=1 Tax=Cohnella cholangitidis TaxID=2598458 RepID=A0A7G5BXP8_9BACL|nr:DNA-directed RNA polymerase subunit beta [Cohnella cholangitidis]QMV41732.1 DNA-directed RNA polymerase subunit beta [Cohnella cholangitidis]